MSIGGVPSKISNEETLMMAPLISLSRTMENPTGLGLLGVRMAKTPFCTSSKNGRHTSRYPFDLWKWQLRIIRENPSRSFKPSLVSYLPQLQGFKILFYSISFPASGPGLVM